MSTELVERLRDESQRLSGHSLDRGSVDAGIASNLATEAADELTALTAKVALLTEALAAMTRRFELYAGPNDMHAGHHDLALLQTARRALSEPDKEGT